MLKIRLGWIFATVILLIFYSGSYNSLYGQASVKRNFQQKGNVKNNIDSINKNSAYLDSLLYLLVLDSDKNKKISDDNDNKKSSFDYESLLISISSILVTLLLFGIGSSYYLSIRRLKFGIKKVRSDYNKLKTDIDKISSTFFNDLSKEKEFIEKYFIAIQEMAKTIRENTPDTKLKNEIQTLENKMNQINVDYQQGFAKKYMSAINSSEPEAILRSVLIAIKNMRLKEAIPQIDILISAGIVSENIVKMAKDVRDYLADVK